MGHTTDIKKVVNGVLDLGRSNSTANSVLSLAGTIINHNIKQHDLKIINPCIGINKLKSDNRRERYLTVHEINQLKDEVKDNFFVNLFVEFALCTGGRLETILHIQKKDIDLANKTVNLNNLKTKRRYTGFLQDELIAILRDYVPTLKANDYVVTQKGLQEKKADHKQIHRRLKPILDRLFNKGLKDDDIRKDGAYTIFYMGINCGAFLGILLCGYLGEKVGWHWGFGLAGIFMFFGMLQFYFAQNIFGSIGLKPCSS